MQYAQAANTFTINGTPAEKNVSEVLPSLLSSMVCAVAGLAAGQEQLIDGRTRAVPPLTTRRAPRRCSSW